MSKLRLAPAPSPTKGPKPKETEPLVGVGKGIKRCTIHVDDNNQLVMIAHDHYGNPPQERVVTAHSLTIPALARELRHERRRI